MGQSSPDALTTRRIGRPTLWYAQVGSTNDVAQAQERAGAREGLLVVTDEQTAGRGRLDRSWWAPPGTCLLFSLLLRPSLALGRAGQLTMCLGLAAAEGIEAVTGLHVGLKWPNDLVVEGRKLGGMLSELEPEGDQIGYAVLGLGLNVNMDFTATGSAADPTMPAELPGLATSLATILGRPVDRVALLAALLARFEDRYTRLLAGEPPHEAWAARLDTLGKRVHAALQDGGITGVATGVTPEGALVVTEDDGTERVIWSGDVIALRTKPSP